jgi:hypothetical protein
MGTWHRIFLYPQGYVTSVSRKFWDKMRMLSPVNSLLLLWSNLQMIMFPFQQLLRRACIRLENCGDFTHTIKEPLISLYELLWKDIKGERREADKPLLGLRKYKHGHRRIKQMYSLKKLECFWDSAQGIHSAENLRMEEHTCVYHLRYIYILL